MKFSKDLERRINRAEAQVGAMKPQYAESMRGELARIDSCIAAVNAGGEGAETARRDLEKLIHDLKGNAGSFGYDMVSAVAHCLHDYLRTVKSLDALALQLIRDHRDSLQVAMTDTLAEKDRRRLEEFIMLSRQVTARTGTDS